MHEGEVSQNGWDWFAVQVWAGRESLSALHLQMRGYDVFLPQYTACKRWSDRVRKTRRALFSGYLFCRIVDDAVGKIVTAPGVVRIVGDGRRPLPVPLHELDAIHRIVDAGVVVEPWTYLQAGQRVCIETGPLRGMEGIVLTVKNRQRLVVAIHLLQRAVAVEMAPDWVNVPALDTAGVRMAQMRAGA